MTAPKALVAGNWKMNGLLASREEIEKLNFLVAQGGAGCDVLICPPATLISTLMGKGIDIGAQDCHMALSGAHTDFGGHVKRPWLSLCDCGSFRTAGRSR